MTEPLVSDSTSIPRVPSARRFMVNKVGDTDTEPNGVNETTQTSPTIENSDKEPIISPTRTVKFDVSGKGDDHEDQQNTATYYKSFGRMSISERLPNIDYYRDPESLGAGSHSRPTLEELHKPSNVGWDAKMASYRQSRGSIFGKRLSLAQAVRIQKSREKFGWIQGVLVRCVLNILGVMLYLRLSWVAGQAGILLGVTIVLLGSVVTTVTALSMSAISTNGEVKGGGAYFMISRSLGPEFGGSIGIIFTIANNVGAAMYIVGFAETVRDLMKENGAKIIDNDLMDVRIVSWATAILLLGIVIAGVSFEAKAQIVLLIILIISLFNYVIGTFIPPSILNQARGVTGYSLVTMSDNLMPAWRDGEFFFSVFAVYFPAATGIMAGANISGDLTNPSKSIPKGTLLAILVTTFIYVGGVILTGSTCMRDASGVVDDLFNGTLTDCAENFTCEYGLMNYYQIMEMESGWGPLITAGIFAATLSSALASLVSAPKILQAVGRDKLFPSFIEFFSVGYGKADEPRRGYLLTFFICMVVIAIGDLNLIAPIISNFFLASYGLVNYACFDASFSQSPGFRPSFKYFNKWVSLVGAFLCVGVMFVISWSTALITFAFILVLYVYIHRRKPDVNWGSSTQANSYKNALKKLQKLQSVEEHVKNYRPQILLLTGTPTSRPALIDFVANITKDNSLLLCGDVIQGDTSPSTLSNIRNLSKQMNMWFKKRKVKAFYYPVAADNLRQGVMCLLQVAGISKLKPNILFMGYKNNWQQCSQTVLFNYFQTIHYGFDFNMGVCMFRADKGFDISEVVESDDEDDEFIIESEEEHEEPETRHKSIDEDEDEHDKRESTDELKLEMKGDVKIEVTGENHHVKIAIDPETKHNRPSESSVRQSEASVLRQSEPFVRMDDTRPMSVRYFYKKVKKATIDVWWLYDDGGLSLLVPHLLTLSKSYLEGANLRVFTVVSNRGKLESEQRSMAKLLSKFRIDYKEVFVIPDISTKPEEKFIEEFDELIKPFVTNDEKLLAEEENIFTSEAELLACKPKTYYHLRTRRLLQEYSSQASLVVVTLPIPRKNTVSASLYLAWLETLTRNMPPMLLLRGNQQSVLTFYS